MVIQNSLRFAIFLFVSEALASASCLVVTVDFLSSQYSHQIDDTVNFLSSMSWVDRMKFLSGVSSCGFLVEARLFQV